MSETTGWRRWRSSRRAAVDLVVAAGLAGFVVGTYVVVVLGGGALLGNTSSPEVGLSILATVMVALGFERVRRRLHAWVENVIHHGQPSPYDVLRQFSTTVTGSSTEEEIAPRMAKALAEGTGSDWAQVWFLVHGRPQLAATWPPRADTGDFSPYSGRVDVQTRQVRQAGELLALLAVRTADDASLGPVEQRLFAGLANQAGLVLRGARLRAELVVRAAELSIQQAELEASRERVVDAHDQGRRRLERDIHDGAQQHLVALSVNLRLAQTLADSSPVRAERVLDEQTEAVATAIATLVDLSRGIYPRQLGEHGLATALRVAFESNPVPVVVTTSSLARLASGTESALYFCALEAVQNATKHAAASMIRVDVGSTDDVVTVSIEDDGQGYAVERPGNGAGLANMRDRIESVGGTLTVHSSPTRGTQVAASVPAMRLPEQRPG
ncbi:MAG TPA: sensor histidine kinase [Nocardioidaceae bacterium]|jgi:signal transduction histidine kinase